jgi:hypothetical protein
VSGYAVGQLARAFVTALTHADPATRERATSRGRGWTAVLDGIASGRLRIGTRTPVAGLPAWVTPEVLRGGFVTGAAAAGGPLTDAERALARRAGLPEDRRAVTEHLLTADGIAELSALLDSGAYRVPLPEHAALLTVAWLVRGGHLAAALDVVAQVRPFGDRLQLAPVPAAGPPPDPAVVHRATTGEVRAALLARRVRPAVARERRTLAVWNPLSDAFVALWGDAPGPAEDAPDWTDRARALLERHRAAAAESPPPRRHGAPGATLEVLRAAAARAVAGAPAPGDRARVAAALRAAEARRGRPGSAGHRALREQQAAVATRPAHARVAAVVAARLGVEPGDAGLDRARVAEVLAPVAVGESAAAPDGTAVPQPVRRAVRRALAVDVADVVRSGVAPSAEVLAALVPDVVAATAARAYPDPALRRVVAATLAAFARRRSLLLTDLSHQVRPGELPWLAAVAPFRTAGAEDELLATLRLLGALVLDGFPGTPLPNAMVDVLRSLAAGAGLDLPWTEELAADIWMGTFTATFATAARRAATALAGTPYGHYYGLPTAARVPEGAEEFTALCESRVHGAGGRRARSWFRGDVAGNAAVIEQAQILTTHDLVLLVDPLAVQPEAGWAELARRAGAEAVALVTRAQRAGRPRRVLVRAAAAWRQMLFHASVAEPGTALALAVWAEDRVPAGLLRDGLLPALHGEPTSPALRFTAWTHGPHPLLTARRRSSP